MKSIFYLTLFILSALALGYFFYYQYRPQIIERGCSEIAAQSEQLVFKKGQPQDPEYSYDGVLSRCLTDAKK